MQDYLDARSNHRLTVDDFLLLDREGAFGVRRTELFEGEVYYVEPEVPGPCARRDYLVVAPRPR